MTSRRADLDRFEAAAARVVAEPYTLRLYVAGASPRSLRATERVRLFCDQHLAGRHSLEVFDLYEQPDLALKEGIVGAPTLVKVGPLPAKKLIGDMRDEGRMLSVLGLQSGAAELR